MFGIYNIGWNFCEYVDILKEVYVKCYNVWILVYLCLWNNMKWM